MSWPCEALRPNAMSWATCGASRHSADVLPVRSIAGYCLSWPWRSLAAIAVTWAICRASRPIALPRAGEASRPSAWLSWGVMKRKWSLRNGAKITSQVSANGRAESSPFQGGVRHGGIDAGKFLRGGDSCCFEVCEVTVSFAGKFRKSSKLVLASQQIGRKVFVFGTDSHIWQNLS